MNIKPQDFRFIVIFLILFGGFTSLLLWAPISRGSVYVGNNEYANINDFPEIRELKGKHWGFQEFAQFFKDLSVEYGGEYGYRALAFAARTGYITANIDTHLLGHTVGDVLYKQKGIDGIKVCTDDLRNACSHSIVVGFLIQYGEESLTKAVSTCEGAPGGLGAYTMCVHGLGHGVLGYAEYDMRKAVALCQKTGTIKHGNQEVGQCVGGVTMEMMVGVHDKEVWLRQVPNYFKKDDPLAPCSMEFIPKNALGFCYMYLTPHLFEVAGASKAFPEPKYFSKAMSYCLAIPKTDNMRNVCLGNFGKEFVVLANVRNVESVNRMSNEQLKLVYDWCTLGPDEAILPCVDSALQSLYWGGENDPDVSIRFCGVLDDIQHTGYCYDRLFWSVSFYKRNDTAYKQSFCRTIQESYREKCDVILNKNNEK